MDLVIWIGGGLAAILLLVGIIITVTGERSLVEERLSIYSEDEVAEEADTSPFADWINVRVERTSFGERIQRELSRADLKLKSGEYDSLIFLSMLGLAVLGWGLGRGGPEAPFLAAIGAIAGPFVPRAYVKRQQNIRLKRFGEQLPDMLNLMVNGLRAGYSQFMAMEAVSRELPAPISDEFRRVVREIQLGVLVEDALDNLLRRIPSEDLDFIITAINIQRESGGNLAEILEVISYTIRERIRIKREIEVLVAQVLYSGRILAIMPIALAFALWALNRPYMEQFFLPETRLCGIPMLICGGIMISAGYYAMTRVASIEV